MLLAATMEYTRAAETDGESQARQLINLMTHATRSLNYDGIFIYRQDRGMDTMRLIHKVSTNGESERLVSLTGQPREVIRNNQSVTCIFPKNRAIMVEKSRNHELISSQLPEPIDKIADHYNFSVVQEDRVAGREAWIVAIKPEDNYRYGYQLWIDKDNHLLLKSDLIDNAGKTLEQILFTKLDVMDAIPDEWLKPSIQSSGYKRYQLAAPEPGTSEKSIQWQAKWMPNGFKMRNYEKQAMVEGKQMVDHIVYTDGLAMVSVFVEKTDKPSQFKPGPMNNGALNAYARMANGYRVTAVGEVPQGTVQRMAISVVTGQ